MLSTAGRRGWTAHGCMTSPCRTVGSWGKCNGQTCSAETCSGRLARMLFLLSTVPVSKFCASGTQRSMATFCRLSCDFCTANVCLTTAFPAKIDIAKKICTSMRRNIFFAIAVIFLRVVMAVKLLLWFFCSLGCPIRTSHGCVRSFT
jgi:hypothetical protein